MTAIPPNAVTMGTLSEWYKLQDELKALKAKELLLRQRIFAHFFLNPVEGTNTAPLEDGWVLKGKYTLNRSIDEGQLQASAEVLFNMGVKLNDLVVYKPDLSIKEYRTLTEEQRKVFDLCLTIKPGTPALEIVLPKKR